MSPARLFAHPFFQALAWALLHFLWQGVLVAISLASANAWLKRRAATARYAAGCAALSLMLVLPLLTLYRLSSLASRGVPPNEGRSAAGGASIRQDLRFPTVSGVSFPTGSGLDRIADWAPRWSMPLASWVVGAWMAGVFLLSLRFSGGWIAAVRLTRRRTAPARATFEEILSRLARRLCVSRRVRLLESSLVCVPTAIGWLKPVILLPASLVTGLPTSELEALVAHELAHIRRHDYLVNLLQTLAETLLFYHPAVWWVSARIRCERENCCDDLAVAATGNKRLYARALLGLETIRGRVPDSAVAANGGALFRRIARLVSSPAHADRSSRWLAGVLTLATLTTLGAAGSALVGLGLPNSRLGLFAARQGVHPQEPASCPSAGDPPNAAETASESECANSEEPAVADREEESDIAPERDEEPSLNTQSSRDGEDAADASPFESPATRISLEQLASLRSHGVTPTWLAQLRELGYARMSVRELLTLKTQGVTPGDVRAFQSIGHGNLTVDDLLALKVQGVTPRFVEELRSAGFEKLSVEELLSLRVLQISPTLIARMKEAGCPKPSVRELLALKAQGVTPEYVRGLAAEGYRALSVEELLSLKVQGVTPADIRKLNEEGAGRPSVEEIVRCKSSGRLGAGR